MTRKPALLIASYVVNVLVIGCLVQHVSASASSKPQHLPSKEAEPSFRQDHDRGLQGITQALSNYIASYASSAASWIKYPYFGVSTGVATVLVFMVVIYILILVSGSVVVSGRTGFARSGQQDLHENREQMTRTIMKSIDHVAAKFAKTNNDAYKSSRNDEPSGVWSGAVHSFNKRSVIHGTNDIEKGRQSINAYVSTTVYNVLTWLSKPYMGYILVLAVIVVYMIVIVEIAMTGNVFPIASLGRSLLGDSHHRLFSNEFAETAERVMKAINKCAERESYDAEKIN